MARAADLIAKAQHKRLKDLEIALEPFAHPDLYAMLGGCSTDLGDENIIYQRNKAVLKIKHFKRAAELLKKIMIEIQPHHIAALERAIVKFKAERDCLMNELNYDAAFSEADAQALEEVKQFIQDKNDN